MIATACARAKCRWLPCGCLLRRTSHVPIDPPLPATTPSSAPLSAWQVVRALAGSILATLAAALGAFLSMGMLGLLLYAIVSPVLGLGFPALDAWDQTAVWPLTIAVALLWAPAFLVAGGVTLALQRRGWRRRARVAVYVGVLWLAALLSWAGLLLLNPEVWR